MSLGGWLSLDLFLRLAGRETVLSRGMVHEMLQRFYGFTNASIAEFKESCNKGEHALVVSASAQTICHLIEEGPESPWE